MLSRTIVETALVGSYLGIDQGDYANQMMKTLQGSAKRLRDRFLAGNHIAALRLLSDLRFISEPLDPSLDATRRALDIKSLCEKLDKWSRLAGQGMPAASMTSPTRCSQIT